MRGKSVTCRRDRVLDKAVYDAFGSETHKTEGQVAGKSKTCRASEWQSHWAGGAVMS